MTTSADASVYYRDRYWNELPAVIEHLNRRATGAPHPGWMHHLLAHHGGRPFERALILNCGNGWVERELVHHGIVRRAVGVEYLPELAEEARAQAAAAGVGDLLSYEQTDVNTYQPPDDVDLVVNHAAAHHIAYVDRVFRRIASVLPADGVFVSWDYVGPHRNQYPAGQWEAAWELRRDLLPPHLQGPLEYGHVPSMLVGDPTEAVHSELILPTLERYFHLDHVAALGGNLGYLLLTHNPALLDADPEVRDPLVAQILGADEAWVERDPASTLFAYVLAHPRKEVLEDVEALAGWAREEEEREARARADGGCYHPPTLVHTLLYPDPVTAGSGPTDPAPTDDDLPVGPSPVRAELRRRAAALPGARATVRRLRALRARVPDPGLRARLPRPDVAARLARRLLGRRRSSS